VRAFSIFRLLLGDERVLELPVAFYQRLLARDTDEAVELAENYLKDHPVEQIYDELLLPALLVAKMDQRRGELADVDEIFVRESMQEIFQEVVLPAQWEKATEASRGERSAVLGVPCHGPVDESWLSMLREGLPPGRAQWMVAAPKNLQGATLTRVRRRRPEVIVLLTLPAQGTARIRLLCRRVRSLFPDTPILVGCWTLEPDLAVVRERIKSAGASAVGVTFIETRRLLQELLQEEPPDATAREAEAARDEDAVPAPR
jgi:hypothetical protein